ncbi:MAG TPA: hypothetical protein VGM12_11855 [Trebonia sp.]|jgi:hypothetical protein
MSAATAPSPPTTRSLAGARSAPLIDVRVTWRRHDPHPATGAAIALLTELYRG